MICLSSTFEEEIQKYTKNNRKLRLGLCTDLQAVKQYIKATQELYMFPNLELLSTPSYE